MDPNTQQQPEAQPPNPSPPPQQSMPVQYGRHTAKDMENPLEVMQPGERSICSIKRHPFGLLGIYLASGFLLVLTFLAAGLAPRYISGLSSQDKMYIFAIAAIIAVIVLLYLYVAVTIYNGNRWIVTTDSITQITQVGLFKKQTSQLSLGNLEDVTFEQESIIQSMFGFGTLHVETAGEHSKFVFPFCPTPQTCAKEIIKAHEQYIALNPEGGERGGNYGLNQVPQNRDSSGYNQPPQQ